MTVLKEAVIFLIIAIDVALRRLSDALGREHDRIVLVEALRRTRRLDRRTELLRLLNDDGDGDVQPASSATVSHLPARAGHGHRQRRLPC